MIPSNPVLLLSFLMYCFLEISIKAQNLYFTIKQVIRHQTPSSWVTLFLIGLWFIAVSGVFYISNFLLQLASIVSVWKTTLAAYIYHLIYQERPTSVLTFWSVDQILFSAPILFIHFLPRFKSNSPLQLLYIPWKLVRRICWLVKITTSSW